MTNFEDLINENSKNEEKYLLELEKKAKNLANKAVLDYIYKRVINRTIRKLRKMEAIGCGDLDNFWEDYCVQIQIDKSIFFEEYVSTVEGMLSNSLEEEPQFMRDFYYCYSDFREDDKPYYLSYDLATGKNQPCFSCPKGVDIYPLLVALDNVAVNYENDNIREMLS